MPPLLLSDEGLRRPGGDGLLWLGNQAEEQIVEMLQHLNDALLIKTSGVIGQLERNARGDCRGQGEWEIGLFEESQVPHGERSSLFLQEFIHWVVLENKQAFEQGLAWWHLAPGMNLNQGSISIALASHLRVL